MKTLTNALLAIGFVLLLAWNPYPFKILELKVFDYLIMNTEEVQNENILIIDLDEEIIEAYNGYPLPRDLYATLVERTYGVSGITVLMPNPDIRGADNDIKLADGPSISFPSAQ